MELSRFYNRNIISLLTAILTARALYYDQISYIIYLIAFTNLLDIYQGVDWNYFYHHILSIAGCIIWFNVDEISRIFINDSVWYLLLHEISTIPFTLIYLLKPLPFYENYLEMPLKLSFAASFILIRSYSLIKTYYSVRHYRRTFYTVLTVLGILDATWGYLIVQKLRKFLQI